MKKSEFASFELDREFLFSRTASKWRGCPNDVIASWIAQMDLLAPDVLQDAISRLAGVVGINTFTASAAETPLGGVKDSGYGPEGGMEGLDSYLVTKLVHGH